MSIQSMSLQQLEEKGQAIYENKLRSKLEPVENDKYVAIDIESEEYFIANTLDEALLKAKKKYPDHLFHTVKIGSTGVFKVSGFTSNENHKWIF